jgi:cell division protein FtsI (penicillin-binding protein 3)
VARIGCSSVSCGTDFAAKSQCFRSEVLSSKCRRGRLSLVCLGTLVWIIAILVRLYNLQITDVATWQSWGLKQHQTEIQLASERGPLYDRFGRLLAVSVPAGSVYVRPAQVSDKRAVSFQLAKLLDMEPKLVLEKLKQNKPFVWVKRQVPRALAQQASELNLPGVGYFLEAKRYYPYNQAASRLIGKVGTDGGGLSGLEMLYERHLQTEKVRTVAVRDALGNLIQSADSQERFEPPKGDSLTLTIDAEMQTIMDEELESGRQSAGAKAAMGVMLDADNGEVLAMGQAPLVNFNIQANISKQELKNLVAETVFEPGSIMKPIVAAAALEAGVIGFNEVLNCEYGRYPFGKHLIRDVHPYGDLSFFDVVVRSSNIGMTKVGLRLGRDRLYQALSAFGFGAESGLHLPGETLGILRPAGTWAKVDVATHSFGQGVAVTPLQMARAVSAIANGGWLPRLSLIQGTAGRGLGRQRVLSEKTAALVREMMYGVVENEHGTGKKALIEGVRVGGKTGTAQKPRLGGRGYQHGAYAASFMGFVDAGALGINRKLALIIIVDEPHASSIYGGTLAAPVFHSIMQRSLHLLAAENELKNIPTSPLENLEDLMNINPAATASLRDSKQIA